MCVYVRGYESACVLKVIGSYNVLHVTHTHKMKP